MKNGPDFQADVTMVSTEDGGKSHYAVTGYRPQCELAEDWRTTGVHEYIGADKIFPGETRPTNIYLLSPKEGSLWVGRELRIMEANKVVGYAKVTEIFNDLLLA
ncbi:MAG: hypothetical protein AAGA91_12180 [Pseudomonadota bacterium]